MALPLRAPTRTENEDRGGGASLGSKIGDVNGRMEWTERWFDEYRRANGCRLRSCQHARRRTGGGGRRTKKDVLSCAYVLRNSGRGIGSYFVMKGRGSWNFAESSKQYQKAFSCLLCAHALGQVSWKPVDANADLAAEALGRGCVDADEEACKGFDGGLGVEIERDVGQGGSTMDTRGPLCSTL